MENRFEESLTNPARIAVAWELIPGRGAREKLQEDALMAAQQAAKDGRIDAVTITDNPGGNPAILADGLGREVLKSGVEALVHFTCKDRNRNQIESQLHALDRESIRNLLVMSGDYPVTGFQGRPAPVFDLDPIHALQLIGEMNRGLTYPGPKGTIRNRPANFFAGVAVSPFKAMEAEQRVQYFKLKKKIAAGARFVVTQLGYDARKFHEVLLFMKLNGLNVPLVGNIYILPYGVGKLMNQNKIPGCVVTDKLMADLDRERQAQDKGTEARLLRAAKMYAFIKGMGFSGVHIGGHGVKYEQVLFVVEKGEELSANWPDLVREFDYPQPGGFYLYEQDGTTGLNRETPVRLERETPGVPVGFVYRLSRIFHRLMFEPGRILFGFMRLLSRTMDHTAAGNILHKLEHWSKIFLYDCRDCGDCALIDVAYVCPMSQCPKNQRNGACGGSHEGWCEVYPGERRCIYVKAYARLKHYREQENLDGQAVAPCNWDFHQTSSWINYFLGRDHSAGKVGIRKPEER